MLRLQQHILEEFATFPQGTEFGDGVRLARSPRSRLREQLFNIEDPAAIVVEAQRLEVQARGLVARRRDPAAAARAARQADRAARRATRTNCKVCGGPTPANDLGPVAEYCGMQCRSRAHYERSRGDARRRTPVAHELLEALREAVAHGASYSEAGRPFGLPRCRVWVLINGRRKAAA